MSPSRRLLLVEDDPRVATALGNALRRKGADVIMAVGARDGLKHIHDVDAIVTDWTLTPGPTGVWLLERVLIEAPHVNRVLYSGHMVPHLERLIDLGVVNAFLQKPMSSREVLATAFRSTSGEYSRSEVQSVLENTKLATVK